LSLWDYESQNRIASQTMTNVLGVWSSDSQDEFMVATSSGVAKWGPIYKSGQASMILTWVRPSSRDVLDAAISSDRSTIALQHRDTVAIHSEGKRTIELRLPSPPQHLELSPDGSILAASLGALGIQLFSTSNGSMLWASSEKRTGVVCFTPDGKEFLLGTGVGYQVRSSSDFSVKRQFPRISPRELPQAVAASQDGLYLACAGLAGQVWLFEGSLGREWARLETYSSSPIAQLAFSSGPDRLCALHEDGRAEAWDLKGLKWRFARFVLESDPP
jgi:WD40 repeat protein